MKAPRRWVAVRHGVSGNGNDHFRVAVNLVREDGTKASVHHDFRRAQAAARGLEVRYGLEQLSPPPQAGRAVRSPGPSSPGWRRRRARGPPPARGHRAAFRRRR